MSTPDQEQTREPESRPGVSRRRLLAAGATAIGAQVARSIFPAEPGSSEAASPSTPHVPSVEDDPTKIPGVPPSAYGERSRFETLSRLANGTSHSLAPLDGLHGIVTPSSLHFERHHNGVPRIDPDRHRLLIHGLVERPMIFTMAELKTFPSVSRLAFIECSGNSAREWEGPTGRTAQITHGLFSTSEWTGVRLKTVLDEVGARPGATWMLAEGSDAAAMTRSVPLEDALDDALLCYAQNGEALRPEQGYPLRLLIPGWEGNICIKWLRRLKLGSVPFMTREETSHYTDLMPDGTARQFTLVMDAKSLITSPSGGQRVQTGFVEVRGLAWSGRGRITGVEVSTDGGASWHPAKLQEPVLPKCATAFRMAWRWTGQETIVMSRCADETGYIQPTRQALLAVRGSRSYYHYNAIQSWRIASDGTVHNVHV